MPAKASLELDKHGALVGGVAVTLPPSSPVSSLTGNWRCQVSPYIRRNSNNNIYVAVAISGGLWREGTMLTWPSLRPHLLHVTVLRDAEFGSSKAADRFERSMKEYPLPSFMTFCLDQPPDNDGFVFKIIAPEGRSALMTYRSHCLLHLAASDDLVNAWTGGDFHVSYL